MSPTLSKTLMTLGAVLTTAAGVLAAIAAMPHPTPAAVGALVLTAASGLLVGWAHLPKPSTAAELTVRAAKAVEAEK